MNSINPIMSQPGMERLQQLQTSQEIKKSYQSLQTTEDSKKDAKLQKACKEFEAMFMNIMFKEMRKTVPKDTLWGESNEDDILQSMRYSALTENLAQAGGVGLGAMMYRQIKQQNSALSPDEFAALRLKMKK